MQLKILTFASALLAQQAGITILSAATFFVATDGNDENPGSSTSPWRSIQRGVASIGPGDALLVRAGTYDERVATRRSGTDESGRIRFMAEGQVVMRGWVIDHAYITVRGFDITGHSGASVMDSHIRLNRGAVAFEMLDCAVRDGIALTRSDLMFDSKGKSIRSSSGGLVSAGFAAGQTFFVGPATNGVSLDSANQGVFKAAWVTDTEIGVSRSLVDQGPVFGYLSASYVYGLSFHSLSEGARIVGNSFRNLGYDVWFVDGRAHTFRGNTLEAVNGWDAMHVAGSNHVFTRNTIRDSPLVVFQVSPDVMENFSPSPYADVVFIENVIYNFAGVLAAQKGANTSRGWSLIRNVFVDVGWLSLTHPGTVIEQNTFLRVAKAHNPVMSRSSHAVLIDTGRGATNTTLRNNIFVDCGERSNLEEDEQVGWYRITGPTESVVAEGNYVAGGPPHWGAKVGWMEGDSNLNGGNAGFVNLQNPLGPDGVPFTDDDGLRLFSTSKLIGAGASGQTPGAYAEPANSGLSLTAELMGGGRLRLRWRAVRDEEWMVEGSDSLAGDWNLREVSKETVGGYVEVILPATNRVEWFRLRR